MAAASKFAQAWSSGLWFWGSVVSHLATAFGFGVVGFRVGDYGLRAGSWGFVMVRSP